MGEMRGRVGSQGYSHLKSKCTSHGRVEKHWVKLNTASRDKSFSLRLENQRDDADRSHSGLKNTLFVVRAQGRGGLSLPVPDDGTH